MKLINYSLSLNRNLRDDKNEIVYFAEGVNENDKICLEVKL